MRHIIFYANIITYIKKNYKLFGTIVLNFFIISVNLLKCKPYFFSSVGKFDKRVLTKELCDDIIDKR